MLFQWWKSNTIFQNVNKYLVQQKWSKAEKELYESDFENVQTCLIRGK